MKTKISLLLLAAILLLSAKLEINGTVDFKKLAKSMAKIDEKLYASICETSNFEYNNFLDNLKNSGQQELYKTCLYDSTRWRDEEMKLGIYLRCYHRHPAYSTYPVVNITYEAAVKYCEWLTEKYNAYPKRKFQRVKFRLPTEKEWEKAAYGDSIKKVYAWYGPYLTNSKGQWLCNFHRIDNSCILKDSTTGKLIIDCSNYTSFNDNADITAPVRAYWANTFGLYNMAGNVAEMISPKGITKGGSWFSTGYYMQIKSREYYKTALPTIGFRVFMEVMEEKK